MSASQGLPLYPFHKGIILLHTSQINMGSKVDTNHTMRAHWSIALICLRLCLRVWWQLFFKILFSLKHIKIIFFYYFKKIIFYTSHENNLKHKKNSINFYFLILTNPGKTAQPNIAQVIFPSTEEVALGS